MNNIMNIFNRIDKNKFLYFSKFIFIFLLFVGIINLLDISFSRYSSSASGNIDAKIAFFVVDVGTYEQTISLSDLIPSSQEYIYVFNVNNFKGESRCNVNLDYHIKFETTTNLPLEFKIYKGSNTNNIIVNNSIYQDGDMYFRRLSTNVSSSFTYDSNQTDTYTLVVNFPYEYRNNPDAYQGLIDSFSIIIDAEQSI